MSTLKHLISVLGEVFLFPGDRLLKALNPDIGDEGGLFRSLINTVVWTTIGVIILLITTLGTR